jgi:hypothetical protein
MASGNKRAVIPWLVIILLVSVLLRIGSALILGDRVVVLPGIHDQISYHTLANQINEGKGFSFPVNWYPFTRANTPTAHWSFIYPLFLAAVYQIGGDHPLLARIIQAIVCGLLSCWLVFLIAKRLTGNPTALFSAGLNSGVWLLHLLQCGPDD